MLRETEERLGLRTDTPSSEMDVLDKLLSLCVNPPVIQTLWPPLKAPLDSRIGRDNLVTLLDGTFEHSLLCMLHKHLSKGTRVLHLGAGSGYCSTYAALLTGCKVRAVEAHPQLCRVIRYMARLNKVEIDIIHGLICENSSREQAFLCHEDPLLSVPATQSIPGHAGARITLNTTAAGKMLATAESTPFDTLIWDAVPPSTQLYNTLKTPPSLCLKKIIFRAPLYEIEHQSGETLQKMLSLGWRIADWQQDIIVLKLL